MDLDSVLRPLLMISFVAVPLNAVAAESDVASLAWLAGCWQAEWGEAGTGEHWLPPAGGTMLGVSRTVKNGKTVEFEFMQLRVNTQGKLVYIALPSGQKETTFVASAVGDRSVTFENPQHDFPQKVTYQLQSDDQLIARIEGTRNGALRGFDFEMKRVACEKLRGE
ncbi:hypothetical protein JM946_23355 [Steroidobacter sp. S1-65]|uniref:DUF6265 domain-containing protein n=1 Tax=Steroidobacter gossypii TaxID=2805490 RepID=A0ABS1X3A4_9GAMM|nr:DUF6265 family protein [Steroidobacter gossypii]MBM0107692.1 hypothetical protein [Steroidobacter gossypii]